MSFEKLKKSLKYRASLPTKNWTCSRFLHTSFLFSMGSCLCMICILHLVRVPVVENLSASKKLTKKKYLSAAKFLIHDECVVLRVCAKLVDTYHSDMSFARCWHLPKWYLLWQVSKLGVDTFGNNISFGRCRHCVSTPGVNTYQRRYCFGRCWHLAKRCLIW